MMYYIDRINTWKAPNRKCVELQEFVGQFNYTLIADEISRDALVEEIRHKVDELNEAYPRTKKLIMVKEEDFIACHNGCFNIDYQYAFTLYIAPVRRTYRFSEPATKALTEGGEE